MRAKLMPTSAIRSTITDMRRRRGMAAPVTRRVSILPEPNFDDAASAVDMSSLVDAEARARAAETAEMLTGGSTAASPYKIRVQIRESSAGGEATAASPRSGLGGRWAGWVRKSADAMRVCLALAALLLYVTYRTNRLGWDQAFTIGDARAHTSSGRADSAPRGSGDATDEYMRIDSGRDACRWEWRVGGCVEDAPPGALAELGLTCALRPTLANVLRCMPVPLTLAPSADCPASCPRQSHPHAAMPACAGHAASVLYRVASELRRECVADGTCPTDWHLLGPPKLPTSPPPPIARP